MKPRSTRNKDILRRKPWELFVTMCLAYKMYYETKVRACLTMIVKVHEVITAWYLWWLVHVENQHDSGLALNKKKLK